MKSILPVFFLLMICSQPMYAQQQSTIHGFIKDDKATGLPSVTIELLDVKDSALVKATLSGEQGEFELAIPVTGQFLLRYSFAGYATAYSNPFGLKAGQSYQATDMKLSITVKQLQDVQINAAKPLVEVKEGKTIFNVQKSINATGSNALELLQKSPGVMVDNNDKISIKGKLGVRIYVDGKMIQLGADDLAAYLKAINSNDIEAIEMINNPGARYDASGNAGVINIRLRKSNTIGTNGGITAGLVQGITPKGNGAFNINYRDKKLNVFSNAGVNTGRYETSIIAPRTQKDTLYDQVLLQVNNTSNYNIKAGVDYFIDKKQTIGIMNTTSYSLDDWNSYGNTGIFYQPTNTYIKKLTATNSIPKKRTNSNTNLNYRYTDTSGREINIDADYGLFRGRANSYQPNYYIDKDENLISSVITRNNTPTDIDIFTARADMVLPFKKDKIGIGAKYSFVRSINDLGFFMDSSGHAVKIPGRSYHFVYSEKIAAIFISWQRQFNAKWSLQAGLRAEHTISKGLLSRADSITQADNQVKRNYTDLFPSATVTWTANPDNSFNLSFSRRIDRPNYQQLNPFELKLDELSYVKGNAFLRPQYTYNFELAHNWKNRINTSISFSYVKDFATQTVDTFRNYTYAQAKNLATQKIAGFNISSPLTINPWWNGFVNGWFNYQVFSGKMNGNEVTLKLPGYGIYTQHTFTLGKDYSAEISGWFNGPSALGPTLKARSMGGTDIGFQKLLLQKNATLKIAVTDVFRTSVPFRAGTDFGGLVLNFWVTRESQTARISFTYRFGNSKIKAARQRQSGLENESKRIKAD